MTLVFRNPDVQVVGILVGVGRVSCIRHRRASMSVFKSFPVKSYALSRVVDQAFFR